uniref:RxLR effector candidate protein n=1 Tax=Hyaloperonospora arabidopsidis (strain Emoy2) TaxID=559515 RepID=M4BRS5_HYAAE
MVLFLLSLSYIHSACLNLNFFVIRKGFPSADSYIVVLLRGLVGAAEIYPQGQQAGIAEFKR